MKLTASTMIAPLLFINLTTSANTWSVFDIPIGQSIYWFIISISWARIALSDYRILGNCLLAGTVVTKVADWVLFGGQVDPIVGFLTGILFLLCGAIVFRDRPMLLHKQLSIFFLLSLPLLFLQKAGASEWLLFWNTEVFHPNGLYEFNQESDLGKVRYVAPVVSTLFVPQDELVSVITQSRPSGFLYSNNVLSIFLYIAFTLNIFIGDSKKSQWEDWVYCAAVPLVMALLSTLGAIISLILYFFVRGSRSWRRLVKISALLCFFFATHYLLFPGLTAAGLSATKIVISFGYRFLEIANILGLDFINNFFQTAFFLADASANVAEDESYSMIGIILRSSLLPLIIVFLILFFSLYLYRLRNCEIKNGIAPSVYFSVLLSGILSQIAVPFLAAPSFQFVMGFALVPLLKDRFGFNLAGGASSRV